MPASKLVAYLQEISFCQTHKGSLRKQTYAGKEAKGLMAPPLSKEVTQKAALSKVPS